MLPVFHEKHDNLIYLLTVVKTKTWSVKFILVY